jgi:hypothetical protein
MTDGGPALINNIYIVDDPLNEIHNLW